MDKDKFNILSDFSDRITQESHPFIGNFFIDLRVLFDFRLGALLTTISTQKELDYIHFKLDEYELAYDFNIEKHFGALDISNLMIDKILKNPEMTERICVSSPPTNYFALLDEILKDVKKYNENYGNKNPYLVHFYTPLTSYPEVAKTSLLSVFDRISDMSFDVRFDATPLTQIPANKLAEFNFFLIEDICELVNKNSTTYTSIFIDRKFMDKVIIAPRHYDAKMLKPDSNLTKVMSDTETALKLFTEFCFCDRRIITTTKKGT